MYLHIACLPLHIHILSVDVPTVGLTYRIVLVYEVWSLRYDSL